MATRPHTSEGRSFATGVSGEHLGRPQDLQPRSDGCPPAYIATLWSSELKNPGCLVLRLPDIAWSWFGAWYFVLPETFTEVHPVTLLASFRTSKLIAYQSAEGAVFYPIPTFGVCWTFSAVWPTGLFPSVVGSMEQCGTQETLPGTPIALPPSKEAILQERPWNMREALMSISLSKRSARQAAF